MTEEVRERLISRRGLWAYNLRILLGNSYWLVVTPVVATQLVLFWSMATAVLLSPTRAAQTIELLAPILGAFLAAHLLAPEQSGVGEVVFVRPVSFERVLLLRLAAALAFVLIVMVPAFVVYRFGIKRFPLELSVLGAVVSMVFLSVLALAAASATRQPLVGFGLAGAFWAMDAATGGYFNPLVSLSGFSANLAGREMAEQWVLGKLALLALAGMLYLWGRQMLAQPAGARRWRSVVKVGAVLLVALIGYVATGAAYKVAYGLQHESQMGVHARSWYQRQFQGYGPLPVAWMCGPAFPLYVQADIGRSLALPSSAATGYEPLDVERMELLVRRYPESIWADNAQFEVARYQERHRGGKQITVSTGWTAGSQQQTEFAIQEGLLRADDEYRKLVAGYPASPFAPLALAASAHIGLNALEFDQARSCYERLIADYPFSPQAYEAGTGMSALLLREGKPKEALAAADVAVQAAEWDGAPEALLQAGSSAEQAGQGDTARDRYQRAAEAAQEALDRGQRSEKRPSGMSKELLFSRCNEVLRVSARRLSGKREPGPVETARFEVTGVVSIDGRPATGIDVALGARVTPEGLPSPFLEGPAWRVETDSEGRFRFVGVPPGQYRALAVALPPPRGDRWRANRPALPVVVSDSDTDIGGIDLVGARVASGEPVGSASVPPERTSRRGARTGPAVGSGDRLQAGRRSSRGRGSR